MKTVVVNIELITKPERKEYLFYQSMALRILVVYSQFLEFSDSSPGYLQCNVEN